MASSLTIGAVMLVIFLVLICLNVPIGIALGGSTVISLTLFGLDIGSYANILYTGCAKYALLSIPFFILAGVVMEETGISRRIVNFAKLLVGPIPGGLAIMALIVAIFWGAVSGSGVATVAALGVVLIPALIEAGYPKGFSAAIMATAGGLSILIPPSIPFIVYGTLANVSVGAMFLAGVVPGLLMSLCMLVYIYIFCKKRNLRGIGRFGTKQEIWRAFKDAFWGLMTPVIILGGIYTGIFTPTEAAMVATWYAIIVGLFVYRTFKVKNLKNIFFKAGVSSASIMMILANAAVFAYAMTANGIATAFSDMMMGLSQNPMVVLSIMMLIVIIAGFFLDGTSIQYVLTPLFLPVVTTYNMSLIWLGVTMAAGILVGLITPPVAANLYPAAKIAGISLVEISKAIIMFVIVSIIGCYILLYFPEITLWLPRICGYSV